MRSPRDEARVKARRGEYIDRSHITVADYLAEWIDAHAVEIKPKTLQDYRHLINRHVKPNIGALHLQAVRPAMVTKLYRDLVTSGGRKTAATHRLFACCHLAAYTGARRGELLHLRWRDIDLGAAEVRISGSAAVIAGRRIEGTTKSGHSVVADGRPDQGPQSAA